MPSYAYSDAADIYLRDTNCLRIFSVVALLAVVLLSIAFSEIVSVKDAVKGQCLLARG